MISGGHDALVFVARRRSGDSEKEDGRDESGIDRRRGKRDILSDAHSLLQRAGIVGEDDDPFVLLCHCCCCAEGSEGGGKSEWVEASRTDDGEHVQYFMVDKIRLSADVVDDVLLRVHYRRMWGTS